MDIVNKNSKVFAVLFLRDRSSWLAASAYRFILKKFSVARKPLKLAGLCAGNLLCRMLACISFKKARFKTILHEKIISWYACDINLLSRGHTEKNIPLFLINWHQVTFFHSNRRTFNADIIFLTKLKKTFKINKNKINGENVRYTL